MSTEFWVRSIIEIVMGAVIVLAFIKEKALIDFEEKIAIRMRLRKEHKQSSGVIIRASEEFTHCA